MLTIRKEQMEVFEREVARGFENWMLRHLAEYFPRVLEALGEDQTRKVIRYGLERARSYGLTYRRGVRLYIDTMFLLGSHFDTDAQFPWAAEILNDPAIVDEAYRMDRLYDRVLDYVEEVDGAGRRLRKKALARAAEALLTPAPEEMRDVGSLRALLSSIHPEKTLYMGPERFDSLVESGSASATAWGLSWPRGTTVYTLSVFMLGWGFASDPLLPWAAIILNGRSFADAAQKVDRLQDAVADWLQQLC